MVHLRNTRGANHPGAKLTAAQVAHIRKCMANGVPAASLAALFGIAESYVYALCNRRRWQHVR